MPTGRSPSLHAVVLSAHVTAPCVCDALDDDTLKRKAGLECDGNVKKSTSALLVCFRSFGRVCGQLVQKRLHFVVGQATQLRYERFGLLCGAGLQVAQIHLIRFRNVHLAARAVRHAELDAKNTKFKDSFKHTHTHTHTQRVALHERHT